MKNFKNFSITIVGTVLVVLSIIIAAQVVTAESVSTFTIGAILAVGLLFIGLGFLQAVMPEPLKEEKTTSKNSDASLNNALLEEKDRKIAKLEGIIATFKTTEALKEIAQDSAIDQDESVLLSVKALPNDTLKVDVGTFFYDDKIFPLVIDRLFEEKEKKDNGFSIKTLLLLTKITNKIRIFLENKEKDNVHPFFNSPFSDFLKESIKDFVIKREKEAKGEAKEDVKKEEVKGDGAVVPINTSEDKENDVVKNDD